MRRGGNQGAVHKRHRGRPATKPHTKNQRKKISFSEEAYACKGTTMGHLRRSSAVHSTCTGIPQSVRGEKDYISRREDPAYCSKLPDR